MHLSLQQSDPKFLQGDGFTGYHGITSQSNKFSRKRALWSAGIAALISAPATLAYAWPAVTGHGSEAAMTQSNYSAPASSNSEPATPAPEPTSGTTSNSSQTDVTVNGQSVDIPANGIVHQETSDENGQSVVDISSQHSSSTSGNSATNNSSTSINITSNNGSP